MNLFSKRQQMFFILALTGLWLGLVLAWINPNPYDQLLVYEKTQSHASAAQVLETLNQQEPQNEARQLQLAELYLKLGQPAKVEALLNAQLLPESYRGILLQWYRAQNDQVSVLKMLLAQQKNEPQNGELRGEIIAIYEYQQQIEEALEQLRAGLEFAPTNVAFHEKLAQLYFRQNQTEAGLRVYRELAQHLQTPQAWQKLAEVALWKEFPEVAENAWLKAWELSPSPTQAFHLAQFYQKRQALKEAGIWWHQTSSQLEKLAPHEWKPTEFWMVLETYDALGEYSRVKTLLLQAPLEAIDPQALSRFFYIALRAEATEALDQIFARFALYPTLEVFAIQVDHALFHQDSQRLASLLENQAAEGRVTVQEWKKLANLYLRLQHPQPVIRLLQQERLPLEYWRLAGDLFFQQRATASGLEAYRNWAEQTNTPESWRQVVQLYLFKKEVQAGLKLYRQQIAEPSQQGERWKELSDWAFWNQQTEQGIEALKQAISLASRWDWALTLAQVYEARQLLPEARAAYAQVAQWHPAPKAGAFGLIRFEVRQKNLTVAAQQMLQLQQHHLLTQPEALEALQLYLWANQSLEAGEVLASLPASVLPSENLAVYYHLAIYVGNLKKAEEVLQVWSLQNPPELWKQRVNLALLQGNSARALQILRAQLPHHPARNQLWEAMQQIYAGETDIPQKLDFFQEWLLDQPENPEPLEQLRQEYQYYQAWERAAKFWPPYLNQVPVARQLLLEALIHIEDFQEAQALVQRTPLNLWNEDWASLVDDLSYRTQEYQPLIAYYRQRWQTHQSLEDLQTLLNYLESARQTAEQLPYMAELLKRQPNFSNRLRYTELLDETGKTSLAKEEWPRLEAEAQTPQDWQALAELAEQHLIPAKALEIYAKLQKTGQLSPKSWRQYAVLLASLQRYPEALAQFEAYYVYDREDLSIQLTLAELYALLPESPKAASFYRAMLQRLEKKAKPNFQETHLLARIWSQTGPALKAQTAYETLLQQAPQDQAVFGEFLRLLVQKNDFRGVLEALERSPKRQTPDEFYYQFRAMAENALGLRLDALKSLQAWTALEPHNPRAWIDLAYAHQAIGDHYQALKAFEKAKSLSQKAEVSAQN